MASLLYGLLMYYYDMPNYIFGIAEPGQSKGTVRYGSLVYPSTDELFGDKEVFHRKATFVPKSMIIQSYDNRKIILDEFGDWDTDDHYYCRRNFYYGDNILCLLGRYWGRYSTDCMVINPKLGLYDHLGGWGGWPDSFSEFLDTWENFVNSSLERYTGWDPTTYSITENFEVVGEGHWPDPPALIGGIDTFFKQNFSYPWLTESEKNQLQLDLLVDCVDQLQISDNNIANILDIASLVKTVIEIKNKGIGNVIDELISSLDDLNPRWFSSIGEWSEHNLEDLLAKVPNLWLMYRYAFKTTKLDVEQAIEAHKSKYDHLLVDQTIDKPLRSHGSLHNVDMHMKLRIRHNIESGGLSIMWEGIRSLGMLPDLHVIWDLIPYSFVADWFVPVDNNLSTIDTLFASDAYRIMECLVSTKRQKTMEYLGFEVTLTEYSRYFIYSFPDYEWTNERGKHSTYSSLLHTADGASLIASQV